jgi:hypothetical protein
MSFQYIVSFTCTSIDLKIVIMFFITVLYNTVKVIINENLSEKHDIDLQIYGGAYLLDSDYVTITRSFQYIVSCTCTSIDLKIVIMFFITVLYNTVKVINK